MQNNNPLPEDKKPNPIANNGWFFRLGNKLSKGDLPSFVICGVLISLGSFIFQPLTWIGSAGLAFNLFKLETQKIITAIGVCLISCFLLVFLSHMIIETESSWYFGLLVLIVQAFIPALVIGLSFKFSESLSLALIVLVDWMFLLALILIPFYGDFLNLIQEILNQLFSNPAMNELIFSSLTPSNQGLEDWSKTVFSILFALLFLQYFIISLICKKWINQTNQLNLSYGDELVNLQSFNWMGVVMIFLLLIVYWFGDITFFKLLFASYFAYFFILGLSILHQFFRKRNWGRGGIIFAYAIIFVFSKTSVIVLSTIAVARCIKNFFIKTNK